MSPQNSTQEAVQKRREIADLEHFHPAFVDEQQTALEVEHLDAVSAAGNQAALEFFAGTQGLPGRTRFGLRAAEIVSGLAQLKLRYHLRAQHPQRLLLLVAQLARNMIEDAQRPHGETIGSDQGSAGIKAYLGRRGDQRIRGKTLVGRSIGNHEQISLNDGMGTKGNVSRGIAQGKTDLRFEPLALGIDQAH